MEASTGPEDRCETCFYWRDGKCRQNSPGPAGWPATLASDWCRRFRTKHMKAGMRGRAVVYDRVAIFNVILAIAPDRGKQCALNEIHKAVVKKFPILKTTLHNALRDLVEAGLVKQEHVTGLPINYWAASVSGSADTAPSEVEV